MHVACWKEGKNENSSCHLAKVPDHSLPFPFPPFFCQPKLRDFYECQPWPLSLATVIKKWDLSKNGTTCVTKTTTHTSKKLRKWPNRDRTTPSSMALFGHYLAKNHPTKNAIEQKYSPRARASSGHAPWRCPTDLPFHGFPTALLTIFYIMNRQQGSRSG
jgi:hypothetical protein